MKKIFFIIAIATVIISQLSFADNISMTNDIKAVAQSDDKTTHKTDEIRGFNGNIIISNDDVTNEINNTNWLNWLIPIVIALIAGLVALAQVKVNNISKARINWCENLREMISKYISDVEALNYKLQMLKEEVVKLCIDELLSKDKNSSLNTRINKLASQQKYKDKNDILMNENLLLKDCIKEFEDNIYNTFNNKYNKLMIDSKELNENMCRVLLSLNIEQDKLNNNTEINKHNELKNLIDKYYKISTKGIYSISEDKKLEKLTNDIIEKSREILNETWGDAKSFILKDIFNFHWNKKGGV